MHSRLLAVYDSQLRIGSEIAHAVSAAEHGPLHLAEFPGGRGFVTYADLGGVGPAAIAVLVDEVLDRFRAIPGIRSVEWKTRGHDRAPGLHAALIARGFVPEETESIMIGEAGLLAVDVVVPAGVELRRARTDAEVLATERMQGIVFDDPDWRSRAEMTIRRLREDETVEVWTAVADGEVISAGRLEPVAGSEFAGLWGGATLPHWRGRGIYRALTARRARSALAAGKRYLQSDSTEFSRPILERSGLVRVSTTTPYVWTPAEG